MDEEFLEIFLEESLERMNNVSTSLEALDEGRGDPEVWLEEVDRELHTIKGSARLLGFDALGQLVHDTEGVVRAFRARDDIAVSFLIELTDQIAALVQQAGKSGQDASDPELLDRVRAVLSQPTPADADTDEATTDEAGDESGEPASDLDPEFLEIFLEESLERMNNVSTSLEALDEGRGDPEAWLEEVDRELHTIKGSARLLGFDALGQLVHDTEGVVRAFRARDDIAVSFLIEVTDQIAAMVQQAGTRGRDPSDPRLHARVKDVLQGAPAPDTSPKATSPETDEPAPEEATADEPAANHESGDESGEPASDLDPEFLEIFLEESLERMNNVSTSLEALDEGRGDPEAWLEEVDRELHTIKGSARLLGFDALGQLVHDTEGVVRAFRARDDIAVSFLIEVTDQIAALVQQAGTRGRDASDPELHERVKAILEGTSPTRSAPVRAAPQAPPPPEPAETAPEEETRTRIRRPSQTTLQSMESTGQGTRQTKRAEESTQSGTREARRGNEDEYVRVRASRLADLDTLVSELSFLRLRLQNYEDQFRRLQRSGHEGFADARAIAQSMRSILHEYRGDALRVHRTTQDLQQLAVDVRLRAVEQILSHIPREARDVARRLGKQVKVRLYGAETELDRQILDRLKSPLSHLVRNAIDHGLESPEERLKLGKPPEGSLEITAGYEGGQVLIWIDDDGRGIDPKVIRRTAVRRGLFDEQEAESLDDEEAIQLVFVPGFSTRKEASQISGRGVGMDVVRKAVEGLSGDVRVQSTLGVGTRFTIRLPLTLLVSRVTFVRSSGQEFGVPTESLQESARVRVARIAEFQGRQALLLHGRTIPLVRLATILGHRVLPDAQYVNVLVLRHGDDLLALAIEDVLDERSVVVKPLGWPLERVRGYSGAVSLASGELALLLNVPDLFAITRGGADELKVTSAPKRRKTILAVDDSIVARQLIGRYVTAMGFDLLSAVDGMEAVGILERVTPDLIVTDLEMPRLNGLGLARRVRADPRFASIPLIIVSTRGSEMDRRAGLEAGADAYLTKAECTAEAFRETVERLL